MWGDRIGAYRVLVGRPEGRRPLGRYRCRYEDNIKIDLLRCGLGACLELAENRDKWWGLVNAVMNFRVPQNSEDLLTA